MTYRNENLKIFKKGEGPHSGIPEEAKNRGDETRMPKSSPGSAPYLPMGCAKGVPGYGIIHPNLINAAVMQCYWHVLEK